MVDPDSARWSEAGDARPGPRTPAELLFGLIILESWSRKLDVLRREGHWARALDLAGDVKQLQIELKKAMAAADPEGTAEPPAW